MMITTQEHDNLNPNNQATTQANETDNSTPIASAFWVEKLKKEASRNWDLFYKTHSNHFFKDRHWTTQTFQDLNLNETQIDTSNPTNDDSSKTLLEVGCGVGNFIWPLLEQSGIKKIHCFDFSVRAINILKQHEKFDSDRINPFVYDITSFDSLSDHLGSDFGKIDLISCIFVLSAIPPEKLQHAVNQLIAALTPGGKILIRDYGFNDAAQKRFECKPSSNYSIQPSKLDKHSPFYRRSDSTLTYFFKPNELIQLFINYDHSNSNDLLSLIECDIIERSTVNRKFNLNINRKFIQARFMKNHEN